MSRTVQTMRLALILPAALLCLAAAPPAKAPPTKAPAAKAAAAKTPPTKAPAAKPPAPAGPFDVTNPQGLIDVLTAAGATVGAQRRDGDAVFVTVKSTAANFSLQFAGCSPQGRACKAVLLDQALAQAPVTGPQINGFNQSSLLCRIYQAPGGQAHVAYSTALFRSTTRDDAATHLLAWQGCLADAADFQKDPAGYLANAA